MIVTMTCKRCGELMTVNHNRKYCDKCRVELQREQIRNYRQRERTLNEVNKKPPVKKEKHVSKLAELELAARAAGMSYGKYVAMRRARL